MRNIEWNPNETSFLTASINENNQPIDFLFLVNARIGDCFIWKSLCVCFILFFLNW